MSFFEKLKKDIDEEENVGLEETGGTTEQTEEKLAAMAIKKIDKEAIETASEEKASERKKIKVEEKPANIKNEEESDRQKTKRAKWFEAEGQLTVDVYQTDQELVIQSVIAGVRPEDLDISIEKDLVTIKGRRERVAKDKERNYFYQECYWGPFSREIILPTEVDVLRSEASMRQGVLTIRMPKIEREKKKKVTVRTE